MLGLAISTTTISYLVVFPAVIKLRYTHGHVPRPYRIPVGNKGAWVCGVLCTAWSMLATVALLYPGFGTSNPDSSLPDGWAGQRGAYEASQFIPLAVLIALGLLFYVLGAPTRRRRRDVLLAEVPPGAGGAPRSAPRQAGRCRCCYDLPRVATIPDRPAITRFISYAAAARGAGRFSGSPPLAPGDLARRSAGDHDAVRWIGPSGRAPSSGHHVATAP